MLPLSDNNQDASNEVVISTSRDLDDLMNNDNLFRTNDTVLCIFFTIIKMTLILK